MSDTHLHGVVTMSEIDAVAAPPARLLLATDLGARCDRALDRAAQLAAEWRAQLIALHVLDAAMAPDQALAWVTGADDEQILDIARRQLARDLSAGEINAVMRIVRSADTGATIRDIARETGCGLVVTGVARNETLGRFLLGSTVEQLARSLSQPLLVVRNRASTPYRHIVVASDFSPSSRWALQTAARMFPGRALTLYHACPPSRLQSTGSISMPAPASAATRRVVSEVEKEECAQFLAATELPVDPPVTVTPIVEQGVLETALTDYVRRHDVELVIMGAHGSSGVMNILLGSSAARLLDWLPCDAMVVREPRD